MEPDCELLRKLFFVRVYPSLNTPRNRIVSGGSGDIGNIAVFELSGRIVGIRVEYQYKLVAEDRITVYTSTISIKPGILYVGSASGRRIEGSGLSNGSAQKAPSGGFMYVIASRKGEVLRMEPLPVVPGEEFVLIGLPRGKYESLALYYSPVLLDTSHVKDLSLPGESIEEF